MVDTGVLTALEGTEAVAQNGGFTTLMERWIRDWDGEGGWECVKAQPKPWPGMEAGLCRAGEGLATARHHDNNPVPMHSGKGDLPESFSLASCWHFPACAPTTLTRLGSAHTSARHSSGLCQSW